MKTGKSTVMRRYYFFCVCNQTWRHLSIANWSSRLFFFVVQNSSKQKEKTVLLVRPTFATKIYLDYRLDFFFYLVWRNHDHLHYIPVDIYRQQWKWNELCPENCRFYGKKNVIKSIWLGQASLIHDWMTTLWKTESACETHQQ